MWSKEPPLIELPQFVFVVILGHFNVTLKSDSSDLDTS